MNCYSGLANRLIKSCFPRIIPVTQLEPLDAKNIIKQDVTDISTNKLCFALSEAHERLFKPKPISDEETWAVTVAWAEAKAKERDDYIIDMIRRFEEEKRISKEKEKSLLKRMLESQSLSSDDTDDE